VEEDQGAELLLG